MRTLSCRSATRRRGANAGVWHRPGTHPGSLGEHNARNAPCTKPAVCPAQWRTAGPARSHRLRSARNATRRPSGARRCGAVVLGDRVWRRSSAKGAQELHRLRMGHGLRRWAMALWHGSVAADRRSALRPPSIKYGSHRNGAAASPTGARTARRRHTPEHTRGGALLVCFTG